MHTGPEGRPRRRDGQTQRQGHRRKQANQDRLPRAGGPGLAGYCANRRRSNRDVSRQGDGVGLRAQHPADHRREQDLPQGRGAATPHPQAVGLDQRRRGRPRRSRGGVLHVRDVERLRRSEQAKRQPRLHRGRIP